ncbi:MAG TPA: isoprenylcysteine carboxylmethyltransferase family protein [bacterium]|nr:isoprenylcysteine carboxylmethyltransferase family protein [Candidatus Omnitrophota bacterium]HOL96545.1 isoprenylcysteine carboxylmethyltransferase family protein [bacterium]
MIWIKTLCFGVVAMGTVVAGIPYWLVMSTQHTASEMELGLWAWLGLPLFLAGALLAGWCASHFVIHGHGTPAPIDPPKQLVVQGPYRYVRNPMYWGVLLMVVGEFFVFESAVLLFYAILLLAGFHLFTIWYEEPVLRRTFGDAYVEYCQRVPRWWPAIFPRKR